jgi:3-dehydrosphinganine reductase
MANSPKFQVTFGLEGWMLGALTAGMGPESSLAGAITQVALMGFFRLVSLFYLNEFWNIVRQQRRNESATKKD